MWSASLLAADAQNAHATKTTIKSSTTAVEELKSTRILQEIDAMSMAVIHNIVTSNMASSHKIVVQDIKPLMPGLTPLKTYSREPLPTETRKRKIS